LPNPCRLRKNASTAGQKRPFIIGSIFGSPWRSSCGAMRRQCSVARAQGLRSVPADAYRCVSTCGVTSGRRHARQGCAEDHADREVDAAGSRGPCHAPLRHAAAHPDHRSPVGGGAMPSRTTTRATTGCYCGCGCRCRTAAPSPLATRPAPCAVASAKAAFRYSRHSRAGQPGPPAPPASARKQLVLKSPARLFAIEGLSDDHFRCVSSVALRSREGPFTEPRAGAQPRPRERVLMPQTGHPRTPLFDSYSLLKRPHPSTIS